MIAASVESPRKRMVRENWDTPVLRAIHRRFGIRYFYWGLPGPEIRDIELWKDMIRRVVAFEIEGPGLRHRRENLVKLQRKLALLDIPHTVYCGYFENTILHGRDEDGKPYEQDELVTLYNLDFCDTISSQVPTSEGRRCKRFEALRTIFARQKELRRTSQESRFIMLLTIRDQFHTHQMNTFAEDRDMPEETAAYLKQLPRPKLLADGRMHQSVPHLKAFVCHTLRTYTRAHNVSTFFLPAVKYIGRTPSSPMLHFLVLCRFGSEEDALPPDHQSPGRFLCEVSYRATDDRIDSEACGPWESPQSEGDNIQAACDFFGFQT